MLTLCFGFVFVLFCYLLFRILLYIVLIQKSAIAKALGLDKTIVEKLVYEGLHFLALFDNKETVPYWFKPMHHGRVYL